MSAYDDALRQAARRAYDEHVAYDKPICVTVYRSGETFYVRNSKEARPPDSEVICIAQRWNDRTVQLRFDGANSEWVNF